MVLPPTRKSGVLSGLNEMTPGSRGKRRKLLVPTSPNSRNPLARHVVSYFRQMRVCLYRFPLLQLRTPANGKWRLVSKHFLRPGGSCNITSASFHATRVRKQQ